MLNIDISLFNEDSLVGVNNRIDDNSVDLVLTDPPYNISMPNNFHTMNTGARNIDFGEWDGDFDQLSWIDIVAPKIKNGGSIVIFNALENMGNIKKRLEENGFIFKEFINWKKSNPMPRNRDRLYVTARETAIWAVKGRGWTFNRQRENYENGYFKYPIVHYSKRIHTTQKPVELMADLIKIHSNIGDTVLDPFSGSGSTGVACINLDRNFIGFELDGDYYSKSMTWLNDTIAEKKGESNS